VSHEELFGRDLATVVALHQAQFKTALELASTDRVAEVLGRLQLSDYEPPQKLRGLERCNDDLLELRRILFYRVMMTNPGYESEKVADICGRLHDVLAQENDPARPEPLPRVDARTLEPRAFYEQNILRPRAVMLDNWDFERDRLQLDSLVRHYGDEPQPLLRPSDFSHYDGPLRDVLGENAYLANSDRLLTRHPELIEGLNAARFQKLSGFTYISSQLFAGSAYFGSPAHFAVAPNVFYQVEGSKKWTIVDPAFSYLTYPILNPVDGFTALYWMDEADAERCPLYRFCPRYEVTLLPGDVLFNPKYWAHSVVNLTKQSIGVAVRWMEKPTQVPGAQSPCALFDVARQLNPRRIEAGINFFYASIIGADPGAWFEGNVHGRTYRYDPATISRAWGVSPASIDQKPRFREPE